MNAAAATSSGYSEEDLIGSNLMKYLTPESQNVVKEMMQKRVSGEILPSYENTILTKDGKRKITEVNGVLIRYEGGPASLNVLTDVTERKRDEEELRKRSIERQQIFRNMINAFVTFESVFDENGKYVSFLFGHFNDVYARISKLQYENVRGKDVFEVWPTTGQN